MKKRMEKGVLLKLRNVFFTMLMVFLFALPIRSFGQEKSDPGLSGRRQEDASVDRNLLVPSAETIPAKTWAINSYELLLIGFTYGINDNLQASCTGILPLFRGQPLVVTGTLKRRMFRSEKFVFSLQGGGQYYGGLDYEDRGSVSLGAFFDYLPAEKVVVSIGAQGFFSWFKTHEYDWVERREWVKNRNDLAFLPSLSINYRAGKRIKLFAEALAPRGKEDSLYGVLGDSFMAAYGIRFFSSRIAVELSFIRPFGENTSEVNEYLLLGFPFLTFSVRF